jgi:hypothetical protein
MTRPQCPNQALRHFLKGKGADQPRVAALLAPSAFAALAFKYPKGLAGSRFKQTSHELGWPTAL